MVQFLIPNAKALSKYYTLIPHQNPKSQTIYQKHLRHIQIPIPNKNYKNQSKRQISNPYLPIIVPRDAFARYFCDALTKTK